MKDFLGQTLNVGDTVILPDVRGRVALNWGKITKITPKNIRVSYVAHDGGEKLLNPNAVVLMGKEQQRALLIQALTS